MTLKTVCLFAKFITQNFPDSAYHEDINLRDFIFKLVYRLRSTALKNDIGITEIGQAVIEIFEFKVNFPRKISKIRNFANVSIIRVEQ